MVRIWSPQRQESILAQTELPPSAKRDEGEKKNSAPEIVQLGHSGVCDLLKLQLTRFTRAT